MYLYKQHISAQKRRRVTVSCTINWHDVCLQKDEGVELEGVQQP